MLKRRLSPNVSSREGEQVRFLVMHYTGMRSGKEAIERLCDAQAQVSAHYVVEENGNVWNLVDEADCAWHAGVSFWRGARNLNKASIGIEIVNPGHAWGYRAFPPQQMEAVAGLAHEIVSRHGIEPRNIVAHSDIAPTRKEDPGELFDWPLLARRGVGLWPGDAVNAIGGIALGPGDSGESVSRLQRDLADYGYELPHGGLYDSATQKAVIAFQRHFRPSDIGGLWDAECAGRLTSLLKLTLA